MVNVLDVAKYILEKTGPISSWKLQKLVYYSQAWSLVWDEQPLFSQKIEAWANGPVTVDLYHVHKGYFTVNSDFITGNSANLSPEQKETVNQIVTFYGEKTGQWLSDLTHRERPWLEAREGLKPGQRGSVEIKLDTMYDYYSSLEPDDTMLL